MRPRDLYFYTILAVCLAGIGLWVAVRARSIAAGSSRRYLTHWNPKTAAEYLDDRENWWQYWSPAQAGHGTVCVSCHTVVPYAMIRPSLGQELRETRVPVPQIVMMDSVEARVSHWSEMPPFYTDAAYGSGKTAESRATESVLNAVILASYDAQHGHLRPITEIAFDNAWALQENSGGNAGGWKWQNFGLAPWESTESGYQGAALLMLALENAPDGYASGPQNRDHLEQVKGYLQKHYVTQPLLNKLYMLWLSAKAPGLMTTAQRKALLDAVQNSQQRDGGWTLSSLDPLSQPAIGQWQRLKEQLVGLAKPVESDGYATAVVALALEESGMSRQDKMLSRGLKWLEQHQGSDGSWHSYSLNTRRDPQSDIGRFMSDAATAYAVMALENTPDRTTAMAAVQ